jgi:hypothetical protein
LPWRKEKKMAYKAKVIKRYFFWPRLITLILALFAVSLIVTVVPGLTWMMIILCIGALLYWRFGGMRDAEAMIDRFVESEKKMLLARGRNKLNLVSEQILATEPVFIHGPCYHPERPENAWHMWSSRIGSDKKWRYTLVEFTIIMFGESQLFIYFACVDLANGAIFHEGTKELFYSDINSARTDQIFVDVRAKRKVERKLFENITIHATGCKHTANYTTELNASNIDEQFTAMRNLIREKKRGFEAC